MLKICANNMDAIDFMMRMADVSTDLAGVGYNQRSIEDINRYLLNWKEPHNDFYIFYNDTIIMAVVAANRSDRYKIEVIYPDGYMRMPGRFDSDRGFPYKARPKVLTSSDYKVYNDLYERSHHNALMLLTHRLGLSGKF